MEKETSEFDGWLHTLEAMTRDSTLVDSLNIIALLARAHYGVRLWFVEILGRRWSYIAGEMPEQAPQSDSQRVELGRNIGLVTDSWGKLSDSERTMLVKFLKHFVSERFVASEK